MKVNKIIAGLGMAMLTACSLTPSQPIDVDSALEYCDGQIKKTLNDLHSADSIDYTMMPRNIMKGETQWNLRKATKEEWTAGFWPGVLWYDYEATQSRHTIMTLDFLYSAVMVTVTVLLQIRSINV